MSKRENRGVVVLFLIGCLLIAAGIFLDIDYYSSIMIGCGAAMSLNCLANWIRNYYHNRPENIEAYQKKKKQQDIDLKDERKIYIRYKSGYITWAGFMIIYFIASFIMALLRVNAYIILICFSIGIIHYCAATIIYKYLCMEM